MAEKSGTVFRWNVNPPWEHFSSLVRESAAAVTARSDFHRFHHLRAALYFAIGSVEAFLNQEMRKRLKSEGADERKIRNRLRNTAFKEKTEEWPAELSGGSRLVPSDLLEALGDMNSLRGEITHDKGKDHATYARLDELNTDELIGTVSDYIVRV